MKSAHVTATLPQNLISIDLTRAALEAAGISIAHLSRLLVLCIQREQLAALCRKHNVQPIAR